MYAHIIFKEFDRCGLDADIDFTGMYKYLVKMESFPTPQHAPRLVRFIDNIDKLDGKTIAVIHLYGTDGIGGVAKYAYVARVTVNNIGDCGNKYISDNKRSLVQIIEAKKVTDDYAVTRNEDGSFFVKKLDVCKRK